MKRYYNLFSFLLIVLFSSFVQANFQDTHDIFSHSHKFTITKLEHYGNGITAADVTDDWNQTFKYFSHEGHFYFLTENIGDLEVGQQLGTLGMYEFLDTDRRHWSKNSLLEGAGHFLTEKGEPVTAVYRFVFIPNNGPFSRPEIYQNDTIITDIKNYTDLKRSSFYEVLIDTSIGKFNPQYVWTKNLGDNNAYVLSYGMEIWQDGCGGECPPLQCINCPLPVISAKQSDVLEIERDKGCLNLQTEINLPYPFIQSPGLFELMRNFPLDIINNELTRRSKGGIQYYYLKEFMSQYGDNFDVSNHGVGGLLFSH